jgi:hypothetical protein
MWRIRVLKVLGIGVISNKREQQFNSWVLVWRPCRTMTP